MSRTVRDANLQSRASRARLPARKHPHWATLRPGLLHLGYAKRQRGKPGYWTVRTYIGEQRYDTQRIEGAVADDYEDANGEVVLNFAQACDVALARANRQRGITAGPLTVADACAAYVATLRDGGRERAATEAEQSLRVHVLPRLGEAEVAALTPTVLRGWLAATAKKLQSGGDEEAVRRSRATANRIRTTLFAALNHAYAEGKVPSDTAWRGRVPAFKSVDVSRKRYLTVDEARRLINAAAGSFRPLVQAALATGARYGELARLHVSDFDPDGGTVFIARSKSSKPRHVHLTEEGEAFFRELTVGRRGDELMLPRAAGQPWQHANQQRPMRAAVARARITPSISFHGLRHTYCSLSLMAGVPLQVVAENVGHADTRMVERHYGHLAASHKRDAIRAGAPRFGGDGAPGKVTALRGKRR